MASNFISSFVVQKLHYLLSLISTSNAVREVQADILSLPDDQLLKAIELVDTYERQIKQLEEKRIIADEKSVIAVRSIKLWETSIELFCNSSKNRMNSGFLRTSSLGERY